MRREEEEPCFGNEKRQEGKRERERKNEEEEEGKKMNGCIADVLRPTR